MDTWLAYAPVKTTLRMMLRYVFVFCTFETYKNSCGDLNRAVTALFEFRKYVYVLQFVCTQLKVPMGNPYHSATSGEMAIYRANSFMLKKVLISHF